MNQVRFLLSILLALLAVQSSDAGTASESPSLFGVAESTLTNGLRILCVEDHHSPMVAVQVIYHVGSADEPGGRRGFAHLFEHMMFRGTDRLGPTDHMDLIKGAGGDCNAFTDFDETCYHQTLPASQLELALWLESERMAFLTVDGTGFTTERKVVEEERRLDFNQPYGDILDKGPGAVFGAHPYGHSPIGIIRDLRQATPADVHAWWQSWYTPNNATLVIAGDVTAEHVRELAQKYFGWMPSMPFARRPIPNLLPWETQQQLVLKLDNAPVSAVGILWRTCPEGSEDRLPLELLATILGGGESSRVYRRLVSDEHLAVMAIAMQYSLEHGGIFGVGAALSPFGWNTSKAQNALREETRKLCEEGVTEKELEKARNQAISALVLGAETVSGKAQLVGRAAVVGGNLEELKTRLERLRHVTTADLKRVASTYLDPQHSMIVNIPGAGIIGQLGRMLFGHSQPEEAPAVAFASDTTLRGRAGVQRPEELPAKPPIAQAVPPLPNPSFHEHQLSNGLRIVIAPNPRTPALHLILSFPFGSWCEEKPGAAARALAMVSHGTELHDEKSLADELERHGIELSGDAEHDGSRLQTTCLSENSERAFSLLAEVAMRPSFPESSLKTSINQALTDLTLSDNEPGAVAEREFERHLFPEHPYGRRPSGEAAELSALHREDLVNYWKRAGRPENATLIISGNLEEKDALSLAERHFGSWRGDNASVGFSTSNNPAGASADSIFSGEPKLPAGPGATHILLVDWPGIEQSEIRVGHLGLAYRDPDKAVANLVGSYFGGSFGSRLMKTIRVDKGATYGVSGGFHSSRFAGTFEVSTSTKTSTTAETVRAVLGEINQLIAQGPSETELALHRRYFLGSAAGHYETPGQIAEYLGRVTLNRMPLDHLQKNFAEIGQAGSEQCLSVAKRYVAPDKLLIVVVGDASRISAELQNIAPVTVLDRQGKPALKTRLPSPKSAGAGV